MIELKNVSKYFKTGNGRKYLLKDINLHIPDNINVGILGRNGAGKSTLLRILGGIDFPSSGEVISTNSFSWPMGLSGGFQGSMTARQNIKFVARVYGKRDKEIKKIITLVQNFAEIGDYFDMPIKLYSSGMKSRLSFGLSLAFDFDYIIIDETLSVGDQNFKTKAKKALIQKIETCNIILVSHSMADLKNLCDSGIVIHEGELHFFSKIDDAVAFYHTINLEAKPTKKIVQSSALYCSDGKIFDNITQAALFYKQRPFGIIQALEKNNGSHVYLKKVFWRDGHQEQPFQKWNHKKTPYTIISSDGIIFENADEATAFYRDRCPHITIDATHIEEIVKAKLALSPKLNVKFYYLNEYDEK